MSIRRAVLFYCRGAGGAVVRPGMWLDVERHSALCPLVVTVE